VKVAVITISDRASRGEYADLGGPAVEECVRAFLPDAHITRALVPDEAQAISAALMAHEAADFIITTGGTGLSPRDITPEVTRAFCQRELPGIAEMLRAESFRETPTAMLSRAYAGVRGASIVVNLPGSPEAARFCMTVLGPVMEHAVAMLHGEGHGKGGAS
jgi:molybdopterin adenylyltransferase